MTLEELRVVITAETSGIQQQLNSLKTQMQGTANTVVTQTNRISNAFRNLLKYVSITAITAGLIRFSKSAITAASDLQEVQNVVDVAFGDMANEVNAFAETAIEKLGMSALTAKQFASTFMAMSNGMGIAAQSGKNMSLQLTRLAADMASFYNVSQDVAFTALKSIFTGETETLKKFGVVMTEANLEAYALAQGITKQYSAMTQAEKVALRYNYVLASTTNAQGDFARTSNSWANQTRILAERWNEFKVVLGNILVNILTPMLIRFNQIFAKVIAIAKAIAGMFGNNNNKVASAAKASVDATNTISAGIGGISDSAATATKSVEKLKKSIFGFDEMNILTPQPTTSDIGDIGVGGVDLGDLSAFEDIDTSAFDELSDSTKSIQENVGKIEQRLQSLWKWAKIIAAIVGGGWLLKAIMSGELLSGITRIVGGLSGLINAMFGLGSWEGVLGKNVKALGASFQMLQGSLAGAGQKIVAFGKSIVSFFTSPLGATIAIIAAVIAGLVLLYKNCDEFRAFVDSAWADIKKALSELWDSIKSIWNDLKPALGELWESIKELWGTLKTLFADIWEALRPIVVFVAEVLVVAVTNAIHMIITILEILVEKIKGGLQIIIAAANTIINCIKAVVEFLQGVWDIIAGILTGDTQRVIKGLKEVWTGFKNFFKSLWDGLCSIVITAWNTLSNIFNKIIDKVKNAIQKLKDFLGIGGKVSDTTYTVSTSTTNAANIKLATGGIVNRPINALVGEAGKEAVLPLESNTNWMNILADKISSRQVAPTKIIMMVDGKQLGYATIDNINAITKQTGSLQLTLA